jgi:hypothetical protein
MTARPYLLADHATIATWWEAHEWPAVPVEFLPALGIVIDGHAAGFLYNDPTSAGIMLEFVVTHPLNTPRQSARAIKLLIYTAEIIAHDLGKTSLFTTCQQPSFARLFQSSGFIETDKNMIHLIKPIT